jgi:hypothetical protein
MGSPTLRFALWAMVLVLLASPLASIATAQASTPNYAVSGFVDQPNLSPMKAGVTVELISAATHQVLTTTTQSGGYYSFTTGSTSGVLAPGWWAVWVPAQSHLLLGGSSEWAVLPTASVPQYTYLSASNLTSSNFAGLSITATLLQLSGLVEGTVYGPGNALIVGASIQLLSPTVSGFSINSTVSNTTGQYMLHAPQGTWVLQTTFNGTQTQYNTSQVTVGASTLTFNPSLQSYLAQGLISNAATGNRIITTGNVTLYDTTSHAIYAQPTVPGFYTIGTYPAGFTGPGGESFVVLLDPTGYGTVGYSHVVSGSSPTFYRNVNVPAQAPPAQYSTTLTFTDGFGKLNVSTQAHLQNDSVFPDLANASVGQLWTQLGLDFNQGSLTFDGSNASQLAAFESWLSGQGPFFPAGQSQLEVNGTTFGQPTNDTFTAPVIPTSALSYTSASAIWMNWTQAYNGTSAVPYGSNGRVYTIAFNFRHPMGAQSVNYTVNLPSGYTLAANTQKPSNTQVLPAGPNSTYTSFRLVSRAVPSGQPTWGSANFTVVKYSAITAIVNISVANFAFSGLNVLNSTRANYTAIVGAGQNVTFSALNSTYPDGTNGSLFQWNFGGSVSSTSQATTYFTYNSPGAYHGYVVVTSSGGKTDRTNFTVYVGSSSPTASITDNATAAETHTSGGVTYLMVNWSRALQFNVSSSTAPLASNLTQLGVLSDAVWSISAHSFNQTANYSAGSGAKVNSNFTELFRGNGYYFENVTIGGQRVTFLGWWYNVSLTLWDGQGHKGSASIAVLVRDTQKPVAVLTLENSKGVNVTASGLIESVNETATVIFYSGYSTDPNNGSVVRYSWNITNSSGDHLWKNTTSTKWTWYLEPQTVAYDVNLTVWDRAGNNATVVQTLSVTINISTRPVLAVTNLTAPSTMTDGSSYTIWGNITNTVGKNSTAQNVTVAFYLLSPSGTGTRDYFISSSSVSFYTYSSGEVSSTPAATGVYPLLAYNVTIRAEIHWTPSVSGSFTLYMNASAKNQFSGGTANVESVPVTINPNPTSTYLEYAIIAVVVVVLAVAVFFYWRRRGRPSPAGAKGSSGAKSGLERGGKKASDDEDDDK